MAIEVTCPSCASRLRVGDDAAGRQVRCGRCTTVLRVPGPRVDPPEPPPPPPPAPAEEPLFEQGDPYSDDDRRPARRTRGRDYDEPYEDRDRDERDERDRPPRRRAYDYDDDDPDRRPRRRRRRPPAPSGRGPLFWVVVIFGVLMLGACACCGGGYLILPGENWRRYESPAGGFAVDVPGPMKQDMPLPGMKPDPNVKVEGLILWKRGEFYVVTYADLPPVGLREPPEALIEGALREMKADRGLKRIVREDRITVSGFPGREIEYVYEDNGTYVARLVVTDRRIYVALGGGRFVGPGNANIRRFLDSFAITGPAGRR